MSLKEKIVFNAKKVDTRKVSTISIRVLQETKDKWHKFCKDNGVSQQATFEAILSEILEGVEGA